MGVDFGDKRTGIAISDTGRILASGLGNVSVGGMQKTADEVARLVSENRITGGIVIGLPVNMNGSEGPRAEHARRFAEILSHALTLYPSYADVPIVMLDERMTTMVASRYLNETDTRGKKRKGVIDTLSAQIILQDALDRLANIRREQDNNA